MPQLRLPCHFSHIVSGIGTLLGGNCGLCSVLRESGPSDPLDIFSRSVLFYMEKYVSILNRTRLASHVYCGLKIFLFKIAIHHQLSCFTKPSNSVFLNKGSYFIPISLNFTEAFSLSTTEITLSTVQLKSFLTASIALKTEFPFVITSSKIMTF